MSGWVWVTDGATRVDVSELVAASALVTDAGDALQAASRRLWDVAGGMGREEAGFSSWIALMDSPVGEEIADLSTQIYHLRTQVQEDLRALTLAVNDHGEWLAQAALIYATAESGAQGFAQVCTSLATLGCALPTTGPLATGMSLANSTPRYLAEFALRSDTLPQAGLSAQSHLSALVGGEEAFEGRASTVARWWRDVSGFFRGGSSGVVVMAEDGSALWGSSATLALGVPIALQSQSLPRNDKVREAFARVQEASMKRGVPRRVLGPPPVFSVAGKGNGQGKGVGSLASTINDALESGRASRPGVLTAGPPLSLSVLLSRIAASGASSTAGEVQILKHTSPSTGKAPATSWTVVVKGTQEWAPGSTNPQDMESNFQVVAGQRSDQKAGVELAMTMAGIQPDDPVEFVGHSQGGAIALDLAGDPRITSHYTVVSALTAGAPTGGLTTSEDVRVLALENLSDLVPALDGRPAPRGSHVTTAVFDPRGLQVPVDASAHSLETYVAAATRLEGEGEAGAMAAPIVEWNAHRLAALGLGAQTVSEVQYYRTTRVR